MGTTNGTMERVSTKPITAKERAFQRGKQKEAAYLSGEIEVMAVAREWIREHGSPGTFEELAAVADRGDPGVTRQHRTRQSMMGEEYQSREKRGTETAYFRRGEQGQAFLFVQAWQGAA